MLRAFCILGIALFCSSTAVGAAVLDQSVALFDANNAPDGLVTGKVAIVGGSPTEFQQVAQSFTVGVAGTLQGVSIPLALYDYNGIQSYGSVTISIRAIDNGHIPLTGDIGSITFDSAAELPYSASGLDLYHYFDFSSFKIDVTPGEEFAIVASGTGSDWVVWDMTASLYSNGYPFVYNDFADYYTGTNGFIDLNSVSSGNEVYKYQFIFNEYVDPVPEPSTWAMMLLGFVGLGGFAGYRRRAGCPKWQSVGV